MVAMRLAIFAFSCPFCPAGVFLGVVRKHTATAKQVKTAAAVIQAAGFFL